MTALRITLQNGPVRVNINPTEALKLQYHYSRITVSAQSDYTGRLCLHETVIFSLVFAETVQ